MNTWTRALPLLLLCAVAFGETEECIECHTDPEYAKDGKPPFTEEEYRAGVHGKMECTDCHRRDEEAFDQVPHGDSKNELTRCVLCHGKNLKAYVEEHQRSVHVASLGRDFRCNECHDPHTMPADLEVLPRDARIELANQDCLRCHRDADFRIAARDGDGIPPSSTHQWLPRLDKHARMRCIVCHTPIEGDHDHEILPREQATRSCEACHQERAPLVQKYVGEDDRRSWITNPLVFEEAYLPGTVRNRFVDGIILALFALTVLGAVLHGFLRIVARARHPETPYEVESTYLYPLGVRLWHWTNALLMIVLAVTGLRLHFGGREDPILTFETAFHVHNFGGALLVLLGIAYFVQSAVTGNARQYLARPQDGMRGVMRQVRFYLLGIFRGEPHPYHATPERKFNPLQQLTYATVMYGLFPLLIVTGIVLLWPTMLPEKIGGKPAVWWFATVHWLAAAAILIFFLGHLYLATMGDRIGYLVSAMFTGRHKHHVPKEPEKGADGDR
jgi:thiosulfate reductase cytochrome b subunit